MRARLVQLFDHVWYGRSAAAWLLWPLSLIYRVAFAMDRAVRRRREFRAPVVVVGNLTVGGTGKTPLVIWLARMLAKRGRSPGIVSRGYRGRASRTPQRVAIDDDPAMVGDEPILLARHAACPVVVGADRCAAVELLLRDESIDVVLADDGLQHHALGRQCEIAVVDGARGLGNGHCLPAGPLREPARRLEGVDAVVVNGHGWSRPGALVAALVVTTVERLDGTDARGIDSFRGEHVHAFAAIGNPQRFFDLLSGCGLIVTGHARPDHSALTPEELRSAAGSTVMITEKDAVKLDRELAGDIWCVKVDYVFENAGADQLMKTVLSRLPRAAR
jgi:tetraacyldisaccharide 4'-kinase